MEHVEEGSEKLPHELLGEELNAKRSILAELLKVDIHDIKEIDPSTLAPIHVEMLNEINEIILELIELKGKHKRREKRKRYKRNVQLRNKKGRTGDGEGNYVKRGARAIPSPQIADMDDSVYEYTVDEFEGRRQVHRLSREQCDSGKIRYVSYKEAEKAVKRVKKTRHLDYGPQRTYMCDKCKGYHTSSVKTGTKGKTHTGDKRAQRRKFNQNLSQANMYPDERLNLII